MNIIENYLIEHLSLSNVVQIEKFSKDFVHKLHQSCINFLIKCAKESTSVYGADDIDKDLLAKMFLSALRSVVDTDKIPNF
uniref:Uncharacterized protein n=1 Tax=Panagrolaimus sp. ES5 TaxID=591445 RepID=A0AC34G7M0_9BILA